MSVDNKGEQITLFFSAHRIELFCVQITYIVCSKSNPGQSESLTPNWCKKDKEEQSGRKNNCVQRKWESHSTKNMFLCCLAADSQIKAAVIWSNICIFLPFFIVCISNHACSCTHKYITTNAHTCGCIREGREANTLTHSQTHSVSLRHAFAVESLLTLWAGGDGTCPLKGSKGQGPKCKGHCLITVATSLSGGKFPPVWGY